MSTFVLSLTAASHEAAILNLKSIVMKKLKTIFAAAALLFAVSGFAAPGGPEKVSPRVKAEFEKNFTGAVHVAWEKKDDFYFANFELNAKTISVAYSADGDLLGMSRVVPVTELPLTVSLALSKKYEGYDIAKTATEIIYDGQTGYYISVENNKQLLKLKCSTTGEINIDKKIKK
jgi:hypothetical protein